MLRPLPSMALICTVYGPLKMFAKMMEEGELLYSLELEEELADSFWNAIRWLDCSLGVDYSIFLMMRYNELEGDVGSPAPR